MPAHGPVAHPPGDLHPPRLPALTPVVSPSAWTRSRRQSCGRQRSAQGEKGVCLASGCKQGTQPWADAERARVARSRECPRHRNRGPHGRRRRARLREAARGSLGGTGSQEAGVCVSQTHRPAELLLRAVALVLRGHHHEAEPPGAAGLAVADDLGGEAHVGIGGDSAPAVGPPPRERLPRAAADAGRFVRARLGGLHGAELLEDVLEVEVVHSPREVAHVELALVVRGRALGRRGARARQMAAPGRAGGEATWALGK